MPQPKEPARNGNTLKDLTGKEWVRHTISWITLKVRPRTTEEIDHPGKYPSRSRTFQVSSTSRVCGSRTAPPSIVEAAYRQSHGDLPESKPTARNVKLTVRCST